MLARDFLTARRERKIITISKFRVGMHDIIYEIQYRHHVQWGYHLLHKKESREEHLYREDIVSYARKNREKSIFYLTHYTYRYILKQLKTH